MPFLSSLFVLVPPIFGAATLPPAFGVGSVLEREADPSISLLQVRAVSLSPDHSVPVDLHSLGGQQSPCEYCQSECLAVEAEFTGQCAEKRGCDSLDEGVYSCLDRCKQRGKKRARPCLEKCPCSQDELADQEEDELERVKEDNELVDSAPDEEINDIVGGGDAAGEQSEREMTSGEEDGQAEEDTDETVDTEEDPFTLEDSEDGMDSAIQSEYAELRQEQSASPADFYQQIRQSPCAFCQSECLVVESKFTDQCVEKRDCDALASGSSDCQARCQHRGKKRAAPCLEDCPCSQKELEGQDAKEVEREEKQEEIRSSQREDEIADIVGDGDGEEEETDEDE